MLTLRLSVGVAAAVVVAGGIIALTKMRTVPAAADAAPLREPVRVPSNGETVLAASLPPTLPDPAVTAAQWKTWQESGLLLTARSAATETSALLVDIRPAEEFQRAHAAGAFQMDVLSLEKSPLLKGRKVIVMDRGATLLAVMARMESLRTAGKHDLRVLDGGLRAWRDAGGKMEGPAVQDAALYSLTPAEVVALRGRPGWKFTALGSALEDFHLAPLLGPAAGLSFAGVVRPSRPEGGKAGTALLRGDPLLFNPSGVSPGPAETPAPVPDSMTVVLSAHGDRYQEYEDALPQGGSPVYYLTGGAAALSEHLRTADRPLHPQRITLVPSAGQSRRGHPPSAAGGCCPGR